MPICYFNTNYDDKLSCDYEIKDDGIEVSVGYDIMDEIPFVNGMRVYGGNTEFEKRDILIIDYHSKRNILVKNAHYAGHSETYGTPDGGSNTKFKGHLYFEHDDTNKLVELPLIPKAKKIKVFSTAILDWIGCPSLKVTKSEDYLNYRLSRDDTPSSILVNAQNIKQILLSDNWFSRRDGRTHISIDFSGYIEIEFLETVSFDQLYEVVYELYVFLQLYCPDRFSVQKIKIMVDNEYYQFATPLPENKAKDKHVQRTVDIGLLDFLKECYTRIPYRNSKTEIRNIPYIVLKTSRSLEDNFLMFYRFIECYYKNKEPELAGKFILSALTKHYVPKHPHFTDEELEKHTQEIVCLRNHYVHSGYYIKNSELTISFGKRGHKKDLRDYTVNNADAHWIYERTKMLYQVVIDIIFVKMLNFSEYQFTRHF